MTGWLDLSPPPQLGCCTSAQKCQLPMSTTSTSMADADGAGGLFVFRLASVGRGMNDVGREQVGFAPHASIWTCVSVAARCQDAAFRPPLLHLVACAQQAGCCSCSPRQRGSARSSSHSSLNALHKYTAASASRGRQTEAAQLTTPSQAPLSKTRPEHRPSEAG